MEVDGEPARIEAATVNVACSTSSSLPLRFQLEPALPALLQLASLRQPCSAICLVKWAATSAAVASRRKLTDMRRSITPLLSPAPSECAGCPVEGSSGNASFGRYGSSAEAVSVVDCAGCRNPAASRHALRLARDCQHHIGHAHERAGRNPDRPAFAAIAVLRFGNRCGENARSGNPAGLQPPAAGRERAGSCRARGPPVRGSCDTPASTMRPRHCSFQCCRREPAGAVA